MKRRRIIIALTFLLLLAGALLVAKRWSMHRYPATEHEKQIALACLRTLLLCTNEDELELEPDDPRLPQILKDLHPVSVMVSPHSFVLFPGGSNNPREYHLSRKSEDSNLWILYIVPPAPADPEHLQALTIHREESAR